MYSNTGWEIQTDMCVHKYACVCACMFLFLEMYAFINTEFFRGILIREVLITGFCILVSLVIWKVYRESQPKGDRKNWGFPTLVPVVSLLIS